METPRARPLRAEFVETSPFAAGAARTRSQRPTWRVRWSLDGFEFFSPDATAARYGRELFRVYLETLLGDDPRLADCEVVFGELTANVARHAPGSVKVEWSWERDGAILQVHDTGRGFAKRLVREPANDLRERRGLIVVNALVRCLSYRSTDRAHTALAKLDVRLPAKFQRLRTAGRPTVRLRFATIEPTGS